MTSTSIVRAALALSLAARGHLCLAASAAERPPASSEAGATVPTTTAGSASGTGATSAVGPVTSPNAPSTFRMLTNSDLTASRANAGTKRVYTNADLDRVHELRAETGVLSHPATQPAVRHGDDGGERQRAGAERYWRREAEKVRERVAKLLEQADAVREQIAAAESLARQGGRRSSSKDVNTTSLRARLVALEGRMRLAQDELEERARREGALPGWLR